MMPGPINPRLKAGKVYRTSDLRRWSTNPSRTARRLVREGELTCLAKGLYFHPKRSRFGAVPPDTIGILRAFLKNTPFLITGPDLWSELNLGATAIFPQILVYNTKRSGVFTIAGRSFLLRRIPFPPNPPVEWFIIDLIEHSDMAGISPETIRQSLEEALQSGRFNAEKLQMMSSKYAKKRTRALIENAIGGSTGAA
jgi:hypothetical protein